MKIEVSKATIENNEIKIVEVNSINVYACPHLIFNAKHYNSDGKSCKCTDKNEKIMKKWGYKWSEKIGRWV